MFELPDFGVDVGAAITEAIGALGGVLVTVLGGWMAFRLLRRALAWANTAVDGQPQHSAAGHDDDRIAIYGKFIPLDKVESYEAAGWVCHFTEADRAWVAPAWATEIN